MVDVVGVLIVGKAGIVVDVVDGGGIGVVVGCVVGVLMVGVLVIEVLVDVVVGRLVEGVLEVLGVEVDD